MSTVLIDLHFLPSLEYFCVLQSFDRIILERHENFNKQSYRNRCYILTAHKTDRLTIPLTAKHGKVPITEVQIDYSKRWQNNFCRTVASAYSNAPFFEHYAGDLQKEILSGHKFLYDLNLCLLSMCLKWLKCRKPISESVAFEKNTSMGIIDKRGLISSKTPFQEREYYQPQPYHQVFGNNFAPNLSVIDLVFCEGPRAMVLLEASRKNKLNK